MDSLKQAIEQRVTLDPGAWEAMQSVMSIKQLKRKEYFLRQDQVRRHLGFIARGYVRLFYLKDGMEFTKDFNFEGSFCGSYASFSLQQPSRSNVMAMEDTELYVIGRSDLYRLFDTYGSLQKIGRLNMEQMFIRKELRESSFLLDSAEQRYRDLLDQYPQILQRVPLKYIASYLGLTAETVSRIRKSMMGK